jgi:hypothetical protein
MQRSTTNVNEKSAVLYDPFQEPENWAERYSEEGMFDSCCRGYEGAYQYHVLPKSISAVEERSLDDAF